MGVYNKLISQKSALKFSKKSFFRMTFVYKQKLGNALKKRKTFRSKLCQL